MLYYNQKELVVRTMDNSDVQLIVDAESKQGLQVSPEKYLFRLKEQEQEKNIALVLFYEGNIAGYVYVYPYGLNKNLSKSGYSEIVDLKIFNEYKNLDLVHLLMGIAEEIASKYFDTVFVCVDINNGNEQQLLAGRGYMPDGSGAWDKNEIYYSACEDCKKAHGLGLRFFKNLKINDPFTIFVRNTPEYPFLRWWEKGTKKVLGHFNSEKSQNIKVGREIYLNDKKSKDYVKGIVTFKHEYKTIREMLEAEGVKNMLPFLNDDDIEKGVQYYQAVPGWDLVEKYGCVAFGLRIYGFL